VIDRAAAGALRVMPPPGAADASPPGKTNPPTEPGPRAEMDPATTTDPTAVRGLVAEPTCSIVIPTFNGKHLLRTCLASIERHLASNQTREVEIVVVDDASDDGTLEWLRHRHPRIVAVALPRNSGFCAAANAGIGAARGRFIQLLNNDTEVTPGWLDAGLAPFVDPTVGAVAPLVLVRSDPARVDSAGDSCTLAGRPLKRGHGQPATDWCQRGTEEVLSASGSSAFYRREALRRVGGFDPIYGSYYEDVDLGFRLRWAGYRCVFQPRSTILHEISATYDHRLPGLQRRLARNSELLFWNNFPAATLAVAFVPHLGLLLAQAAWRLVRLRFLPFYLGKLDALRAVPEILQRRRIRTRLARQSSFGPPHFPLHPSRPRDLLHHLRRPPEASARPTSGGQLHPPSRPLPRLTSVHPANSARRP
jgi:GT2 family glycosyltransferase